MDKIVVVTAPAFQCFIVKQDERVNSLQNQVKEKDRELVRQENW